MKPSPISALLTGLRRGAARLLQRGTMRTSGVTRIAAQPQSLEAAVAGFSVAVLPSVQSR